ncbi:MAG: CoA transferase, partial [Dehalococcoidia bacterium]|nr:CoA transferase [Dehalococcoidia bacterium]
ANPMMNFYRCQDGKWLFLSLLQQDRHWGNFCQAIGRAEMENNPLFETADKRRENRGEMISIMDKIFATRTCDEWISVFQEFPDFIYERVNSVSDLPEDPQVVANDYIVDFPHPTIGDIKMINVPVTYSKTPGGIQTAAPECGQHTEEVLTEICGYSWDEVAGLRESQVI